MSQTSCLAVAFLSAVALAKEEAKAEDVFAEVGAKPADTSKTYPSAASCHGVALAKPEAIAKPARTLEL